MVSRSFKKAISFIIIIIAMMVVLSFCFGNTISNASAGTVPKENTQKSYTSIQIISGDSLWSIAKEYVSEEYASVEEYVEEIKAVNNLSSDTIHAGQYLVVVQYTEAAEGGSL